MIDFAKETPPRGRRAAFGRALLAAWMAAMAGFVCAASPALAQEGLRDRLLAVYIPGRAQGPLVPLAWIASMFRSAI